ncbi:MAG: hypothetical protein KAT83_03530 [Candidatus Aenigmarchaeota archaeon]|nr:hypothetical protein [Candidatus Aenigmarchaeota archaeon]
MPFISGDIIKILFVPSTIGMHEIYFREVTDYLEGEDGRIEAETFLPVTLEEYREKGFTLEKYAEELETKLKTPNDTGEIDEYMLVSLSNGGNALLDAALDHDNVRAAVFCDFVGDWDYQDLIFKVATYVFEHIPKLGDWKPTMKLMLSSMFDHSKNEKIYQELVELTETHGGKDLINALTDTKKHTFGKRKYIEKLEELVAKKDIRVYSIEATKSADTKKYFNAIDLPEIERTRIESRHLIPLQKPEELAEKLHEIYKETLKRCGPIAPTEPFPQEQQELLQILSL